MRAGLFEVENRLGFSFFLNFEIVSAQILHYVALFVHDHHIQHYEARDSAQSVATVGSSWARRRIRSLRRRALGLCWRAR